MERFRQVFRQIDEHQDMVVVLHARNEAALLTRPFNRERIVIGPPQNESFELELPNETISVLMDPGHDLEDAHSFMMRTCATDPFFAVTQLKGHSYSIAKRGRTIKDTALPTKPDFSSYMQGSKPGFSPGN